MVAPLGLIRRVMKCTNQSLNSMLGEVIDITEFSEMPNSLLMYGPKLQAAYMNFFQPGDRIIVLGTGKGKEVRDTHTWVDSLMRCHILTYFVGLCLKHAMKHGPLEIPFKDGVVGSIVSIGLVRCQVKTIAAGFVKGTMLCRTKDGEEELNHYLLQMSLNVPGKTESVNMYAELTGEQLLPTSSAIAFFPENRTPKRYKNLQPVMPLSIDDDAYVAVIGGNLDYIFQQLKSARFL